MDKDVRIQIPKAGLEGFGILIALGPEGVRTLCEAIKDLPLTLRRTTWLRPLSRALDIDARSVSQLVMGVLMPLNHLRVDLKLETTEFLEMLSRTVEQDTPEDWRKENLAAWHAIRGLVAPLFERDNFFSLASRSLQLLVNRPNPVQGVKILSELRPVYSEDATSVKAFVLADTLVVDYHDGTDKKSIYLSMDLDDLNTLSNEVVRAKLKNETISEAVSEWGSDLLSYGERG